MCPKSYMHVPGKYVISSTRINQNLKIEVEWQGLKDEIRDGVLEENLPIDNGIIDFIIKQVKFLNLSEIDVKTLGNGSNYKLLVTTLIQ